MPCDFDLQGSAEAKQLLRMLVRMRAAHTVIASNQRCRQRIGTHRTSVPTIHGGQVLAQAAN